MAQQYPTCLHFLKFLTDWKSQNKLYKTPLYSCAEWFCKQSFALLVMFSWQHLAGLFSWTEKLFKQSQRKGDLVQLVVKNIQFSELWHRSCQGNYNLYFCMQFRFSIFGVCRNKRINLKIFRLLSANLFKCKSRGKLFQNALQRILFLQLLHCLFKSEYLKIFCAVVNNNRCYNL